MRGVLRLPIVMVVGWLAISACTGSARPEGGQAGDGSWRSEFSVSPAELSATGRNPYFILESGYGLVLEGAGARTAITVLDETRVVDGVETRVVEERHTEGGQLVEISRNYFAISKKTNDVYYFGEDVDIYKGGAVVGHDGAWLSGQQGAKFGLMMAAQPKLTDKYFQEVAPGVAMDRAEVQSVSETVTTAAGEFKDCVKVEETTPLEPTVKDYKYHCPGIGLAQDGAAKLVQYGKVAR